MTDSTIHNLTYFLTELEKNINIIEACFEKEYIALQSMLILHATMTKMCQNWQNKSDTPGGAGGLMNVVAPRAITPPEMPYFNN